MVYFFSKQKIISQSFIAILYNILTMKRGNIRLTTISIALLLGLVSCGSNSSSVVSKKFLYASGSSADYAGTSYYTDDYFSAPATTYNASLATTSLTMAMSSFASNEASSSNDYTHRYKNAETLLSSYGFGSITPNADYQKKPETDTIGVVYANKKIGDSTLLAVGIRGANYQQEWASNFTLGYYADNSYHSGFYKAANELVSGLKSYISDTGISGSIKVWISGYSRAGATANISSGLLDKSLVDKTAILGDNVTFTKEDIYAYCFEPPQGAYYDSSLDSIEVHGDNYNNIFNIVNSNDPVPMVAMNTFGFTRFGIDKYVTDPLSDPDYSSNINKIKDSYQSVSNYKQLGEAYLVDGFTYKNVTFGGEKKVSLSKDSYHINWTQGLFLNEFVSDLATNIGDRDTYVSKIQDGMRNVFGLIYKNGAPKGSFIDVGINFVKQLISGDEVNILMDDLVHESNYFVRDLIPLVSRTLEASGILDLDIKTLVNNVTNLLLAVAKIFFQNASLIVSLISTSNVKTLGSAHYPELCLAHMEARDPNYSRNPVTSEMSGRYYYFESSDSTKSFTIKKNGRAIAKASLGEVIETNSSIVYGIHHEKFVAYLPIDSGYTIEMESGSTASLSVYEPSKLKNVLLKDITTSSKINDDISVSLK
jgi:hypothetical protein